MYEAGFLLQIVMLRLTKEFLVIGEFNTGIIIYCCGHRDMIKDALPLNLITKDFEDCNNDSTLDDK